MNPRPPLAILEQLGADGQVLRTQTITQWPFVMGRAMECDFITSDEHVAARHLSLNVDTEQRVHLQVGDSVNGVQLLSGHSGVQLSRGQTQVLSPGQPWRMGLGTYRVRLSHDPLAAEVRIPPEVLASAWQGHNSLHINWRLLGTTALWALAMVVWLLVDQWLDGTPQTRWTEYLKLLLKAGASFGLWALLWAMVSKLFVHRLLFVQHLRVALSWSFIAAMLSSLLPLLGFMFDAPVLSKIALYVGSAFIVVMLSRHLGLLLPAFRGWIRKGLALVYVIGVGALLLLNQQQFHRYFREPYMATLAPPALLLARPHPVSQLLGDVRHLQGPLQGQAEEDEDDGSGADGD